MLTKCHDRVTERRREDTFFRPSFPRKHSVWQAVPARGECRGGDNSTMHTAQPRTQSDTGDPRLSWSSDEATRPPTLGHRRDGILPTVAAALSVRGTVHTSTAAKADRPPALHPLVQDFLSTLTSGDRERFTGRCAEALVLSRHLTTADGNRSKRAQRRPMTYGEAKRALKGAKLTARRIREDGDPLHGGYAPPCRSCTAMLDHFGVRAVDPGAPENG